MPFDKDLADRAEFSLRAVVHTKSRWRGKPFQPLDYEVEFTRKLFGTINADGTRQYRRGMLFIPKKNGKALDVDTPIPVPQGWKRIGDVRVGDVVFDESGRPQVVQFVSEVMYGHPCYRVTFSDGAEIVADAEHLWETETWRPWRAVGLWTTEQIRETLLVDSFTRRGQVCRNHKIGVAGPLDIPDMDLPVPPYALGAWLGDGNSRNAGITCADQDAQIIAEIHAEGLSIGRWKSGSGRAPTYCIGSGGRSQKARDDSFNARLRQLGVIQNKHIPAQYLRASIAQRTALLQGLMDTDGSVARRGECEFGTTRAALRDGAMELIASLGLKPLLRSVRATIYGRDCGPNYRIQFFAFDDQPVFRLGRKRVRQKPRPERRVRSQARQIVAVDPVESRPVCCISVSGPAHLYLAGRAMIPTHNTEYAGWLANHLAFCDNEPGAEVYFAAADLDQAARAFDVATTMIRYDSELDARCRIKDSQKKVTIPETGSYLKVLSSEHRGKHGANIHGLVFDEMHAQPHRKLYDTLTFGTGRARPQPLHFFPSTAGDDMDSICYQLWQEARDIRDGVIDDPTTLVVLYEAPDDADIESPDVWAGCNPALGHIFTKDDMRAELAQAKRSVADEMLFRQLSLNQWVASAEKWLPTGAWGQCTSVEYGDRRAARKAVDALERELRGQPCVAALDLGSVSDTTAFGLLFRDGNRVRCIARYWMPKKAVETHADRGRVQYRQWVRDGWIKATDGDVVDYRVIREDIKALGEMYGIQRVCFDRAFAGQLAQDLEDEGFEMASISQGYSAMNGPSQEFEALVLDGRFDHAGHPVLWYQADSVAIKQDTGGQIRPAKPKRGASVTIDGIVAAVMALGGLIALKVQGPSVYETRGVITL